MKKHLSILLGLAFMAGVAVTYASTLWFGSLTNVNNTTAYTGTNAITVINQAPGTFQISDGGLTALTALVINLQWGIDSNNFVTVASWTPSTTNAGTVSWSPGILTTNLYQRFQIITTNSVNVGINQP